jgi:hypothetical protein
MEKQKALVESIFRYNITLNTMAEPAQKEKEIEEVCDPTGATIVHF